MPLTGSLGPVDPGVVVIAADDPLVGIDRARDPRDDVADRRDLPVEGDLEMDLRGAGTDVVRDREGAAPLPRRDRPPSAASSGSASP